MEKPSFSDAKTLGDLLWSGLSRLEGKSDSPRLDSEVILLHLLGYSRARLLTSLSEPCDPVVVHRFGELVARREQGEPVAYLTGEREFWGHPFLVSSDVLVPRPESELIVERGLVLLAEKREVSLLDLGVGSGCLAISLTKELLARGCSVSCDAVDISRAALRVAQENARRLGVSSIRFVEGNWFETQESALTAYDLIIANPPYIDRRERVPVELSYEPAGALFSPDEGLQDTKTIIASASRFLKPGGALLCEVGAGKRRLLPSLFEETGSEFTWSLLGDDSPLDRFTVIEGRLGAAA